MAQATLSVRLDRADFDIAGDSFDCEANQRWIRESLAQMKAGRLETHELVEDEDCE